MLRTTEIIINTGRPTYGVSLDVLFTQLAKACKHEGVSGEMKIIMHHDGSVTTDDGRLIFSPQKKSQIQQPLARKG